ncbi:MAG TPA: alpha-D-ribose 1-methylphosphonate 5-triphosphate diphosphatase [Acidimicrobiales bacterium]|nr:alpha-D-ribose 1-methylphosphonate 5-triphosphate diphosphatase [Acidimicrobiales bacterium]
MTALTRHELGADELPLDAGARLAVRHVRAVLADRVVDDATVVCEDGRIVSIVAGGPAPADAIDGRGAFLLPGLVDSHSDGLEKEIRPRPTSKFGEDFALRNFEGRLLAAGITTVFHGVGFEERTDSAWAAASGRSIAQAEASCRAIAARDHSTGVPVDHRVLYRMEARSPVGIDEAEAHFARPEHAIDGGDALPLVSFEDHSPGQGQFRSLEKFAEAVPDDKLPDGLTKAEYVAERVAAAEAALALRHRTLHRLVALARAGRIRLLAHDCEDADQVSEAHDEWAAAVAEFPLTLDAASRARALGMEVVMGAPNVLLGGSHSGNVAAEDTVRAGLCSALASDYLPASMLAAAFELVDRGAIDLPGAVALVTSGPARVAGLVDRGRLEPGLRADLVLVSLDGRWPRVHATWRAHTAGAAPMTTSAEE